MYSAENLEKLKGLIKGIQFCMLTTLDDEGSLRSRPLTTQETTEDGYIWFFISNKGTLVEELHRSSRLNLAYSDPSHNRYVSVSGHGALIRDSAMAKKLWTPVLKAWFPKGLEDPDLALLRVDIEKAEYWDAPNSKLVQIAGFIKSIATGERLKNVGDHQEFH